VAAVDVDAGAAYLYCYDANGNVGQVVGAGDGSLAARYEYDGFGQTVLAEGDLASQNPYRFSTKVFDEEVNLYYYGYRYYAPELLGRWISRDSLEEQGGANLYGFVLNDSINGADYLGLYTIDDAFEDLANQHCKGATGRGLELCLRNFRKMELSRDTKVSDKELFNAWYELEINDMTWTSQVPDCPCTLCLEGDDPVKPKSNTSVDWRAPDDISIFSQGGHPGGVFEMRSEANGYGAGQQCVYDKHGVILDALEEGPGTMDRKTPSLMLWLHIGHDVQPFKLAKRIDGGGLTGEYVRLYFRVRKLNTKKNCIGKK
jgi:RHS repeat-associated protein